MKLIERAKNILLQPRTEWQTIAIENTSQADLFLRYVIPLAAIGPIAVLLGQTLLGVSVPFIGTYRVSLMSGIATAVITYAFALLSVLLIGLIINALAPSFSGEKNFLQALKCAVYAYTPAWLAGIFNLLPMLSILVLLAALYGIYLLYLALPILMKSPKDKAVGYTVVTILCVIVISAVLSAITGLVAWQHTKSNMINILSGTESQSIFSSPRETKPAPDSVLGKLDAFTQKLEESTKKMEQAEKKGDVEGAMSAAMEGFATLASGGKKVQPLAVDELKTFLPENFEGMQRSDFVSEQNSFAGMTVTLSSASYQGAQGRVQLGIGDISAAGGLIMLTNLLTMGAGNFKETESGYEKIGKHDGRIFIENFNRSSKQAEFGLIIGERFLINARSQDFDPTALRTLISKLDLARLEALKNKGVQ